MKPEEFCYWLMGSLELTEMKDMDEKQTKVLKKHLDMVFEHVAHLEENTSYEINGFLNNLKPGERC